MAGCWAGRVHFWGEERTPRHSRGQKRAVWDVKIKACKFLSCPPSRLGHPTLCPLASALLHPLLDNLTEQGMVSYLRKIFMCLEVLLFPLYFTAGGFVACSAEGICLSLLRDVLIGGSAACMCPSALRASLIGCTTCYPVTQSRGGNCCFGRIVANMSPTLPMVAFCCGVGVGACSPIVPGKPHAAENPFNPPPPLPKSVLSVGLWPVACLHCPKVLVPASLAGVRALGSGLYCLRTDYARKAAGQARLERKWRFRT